MKYFFLFLFSSTIYFTFSQFAPPAGFPGSTAISASDPKITLWANYCTVKRGLQCIDSPRLGNAFAGDSLLALGKALENGTVSLGDGGYAIVKFAHAIKNGNGFDFAVFENSFSDSFLELATVSVSTDGIKYIQFPCVSNTQTNKQVGGFGLLGAGLLNNLAGKYRAGFGTPFDLNELKDSAGINIDSIVYVKITDVIGKINSTVCAKDKNGNYINDPYPTPFPGGGFDLDAVGVIHSTLPIKNKILLKQCTVFPNPIIKNTREIFFNVGNYKYDAFIFDGNKCIDSQKNIGSKLILPHLTPGLYFIKLQNVNEIFTAKFLVLE